MGAIISHEHSDYRFTRDRSGVSKYNGAYYYSVEIVKNIIPNIDTSRPWVTIMVHGYCLDNSIVFIHNNLYPERYNWMSRYKNLILVCGIPETMDKVKHLGTPIYLPLSIDVDYVSSFKKEKTKDTAFAGRAAKKNQTLPDGIDYLEGLPRNILLNRMAEYKNIYAVGRTAIEARALGCNILPYDPRFPDTSIWKVMDNSDAVKILQNKLDEIDGGRR